MQASLPTRARRSYRQALLAAVTAALVLLGIGPPASPVRAQPPAAAAAPASAAWQQDPYVAAANSTGVPLALLAAVAGAESGYHPWAVNFNGREIYCSSRAEAARLVALSNNVDIGLMQINWAFWGRRLGLSKEELLDPRTNLLAGARILKLCLQEGGDLWERIGAYHSRRPAARAHYNQQVYDYYQRYLRGELR